MIERVLVLGGGTAGLLTAAALKVRLPALRITVLRSVDLGVIGVGEGTMPDFPELLHAYLGIGFPEFYRAVAPTPKLGIRFLWGPRPSFNFAFGDNVLGRADGLSRALGYYADDDMEDLCEMSSFMSAGRAYPRDEDGTLVIGRDVAYHLDNERLVAYLETFAASVGVELRDEVVADVRLGEAGVTELVTAKGEVCTADLYVDSSGFRSLLVGEALAEPFVSYRSTLFCDRAVAGSWERGPEEPIRPYTTAETWESGWCWQIEHERRIVRGYVYSSDFVSDEDAERALRAACPKVTKTRLVKFRSGRVARSWVKNVVAVGNASGFVEPLEATSLGVICREARRLAETLRSCACDPGPMSVETYNRMAGANWDGVRDFLAVHYKFNTRRESPFWRACRADVDLCGATDLVAYYEEEGPNPAGENLHRLTHPFAGFTTDAYYTLLVGQKVPYRRRHVASPAERRRLAELRAANRAKAQAAYRAEDALELLR